MYWLSDVYNVCKGMYMFTEKTCRHYVARDTTVCNGTVRLNLIYNIGAVAHIQLKKMIESTQEANKGTKINNMNKKLFNKGILLFGTGW